MTVSIKMIQMLALMEHSPRYAMQMAVQSPEVFTTQGTQMFSPPTLVRPSTVYKMLKTAERNKLVERAKDYEPPPSVRALMDPDNRGPIVWYQLTPQGRHLLNSTRQSITPKSGLPPEKKRRTARVGRT